MPVGPLELVIILVIVLVLFGGGRVANLMGELGSGLANFRKGLREGDVDEKKELEDGKPKE